MGRYKSECSRKQEKIFLGSDNDTLSSRCQYLPDYLPVETGSYRRGRGLGGRVGVASGRLEGSGGGEASKGEVREGAEDDRCKPQNDIDRRSEQATPLRTVRRGGRVSYMVKTLEEGSKQNNKIISYF